MLRSHERVRASWALAASLSDDVGRVFYATLFRLDPSTKPLFVGDLELQGRKLVQTLGFIVDHLDDPAALVPAAQALAIRHVAYGATADHYGSVGESLVLTLRQVLGSAFSSEDEAAWAEVYAELSSAMIQAAYPPRPV